MNRNGPSEFTITGSLKNWTIVDRIAQIERPVLLTNGLYDEAQNSVLLPFFDSLKDVAWVKFAQSAHMAHLEEPEKYLAVLSGFLVA